VREQAVEGLFQVELQGDEAGVGVPIQHDQISDHSRLDLADSVFHPQSSGRIHSKELDCLLKRYGLSLSVCTGTRVPAKTGIPLNRSGDVVMSGSRSA